ncbi:GAF domain-containing protein [Desulfohalovibrio reitneri]|uniref:GAF domain-containing protein n=1 Tax=Desulfohalovibrio reitneri TaxID=1307759 RepID=UPI0004A727DD|nr:GAF domain-containing protein [Desulfohalovibrio reitneri]
MPVQDTCQHLLGIICNVFDAHSAVLFLPEGKEEFGLQAFFSLSDRVRCGARIAPGQGLAGWIIRNRKPLLINNFDQKRGVLGYYEPGEEASIRAFMGCPLDNGEGALCLDSKRTYSFSDKDQKILHQFAQLISGFNRDICRMQSDFEQHRYYRALETIFALREKHLRWSSFLESLLGILAETTGMGCCFLAVRDDTGSGYFLEGATCDPFQGNVERNAFSMNSGTIGWVFKHNSPVFAGGREKASKTALFGKEVATAPFNSLTCLPLLVHKKTRGVLVLADERPRCVDDGLRTFLEMAASNVSLFLENLYLKNRLTSG